MAYHPARHSGTSPRVSAIAWNAVRDQWNAQPAEEAAHRAKLENSRRERELEEAKRKATARKRALSMFEDAALCDSHPYTGRKGIQTHGARLQGDRLVLPMRDADGTRSRAMGFEPLLVPCSTKRWESRPQ